MPKPYSHSQLSTYENCPYQFKLVYIDKIERAEENVEAFMGTSVHDALEKLYRDLMVSKTNTIDELLAYFEEQWKKNWHDDIVIVREEYTQDNYRETGRRCIANYYRRHQPFDQDITVGLEERLRIPVDEEEKYVLSGFVDRISKTSDERFAIHDYKTSHSLPPQEKVDRDRQLSLYQIGVQHKWPSAREVDLIWHYVAMDVDMVSKRSKEHLQTIKKEVIGLIEEIEGATDFEPNKSALCNWCGFQDLCPLWKHPMKVGQMKLNEYMEDDGVQLVNKYMNAVTKRKVLQEKIAKLEEGDIAKLKEALFAYAKKEGAQVVQGSDYRLNLKTYENYKFPSKRDEEKEFGELLELIKKSPIWDQVATLDTWALSDLLKEGKLDKKLKEKILAYAALVEEKRIYPSKADN